MSRVMRTTNRLFTSGLYTAVALSFAAYSTTVLAMTELENIRVDWVLKRCCTMLVLEVNAMCSVLINESTKPMFAGFWQRD